LDVSGDGQTTAATDGLLISRFLFGYRGQALIDSIPLSPTRPNAASVFSFIGTGAQFDVFGRNPPSPIATLDGIILTRLMRGIPDSNLLSGVVVPSNAEFVTAAAIRAGTKVRCSATF
jgi:hypothetical protein